MLDLSKKYKTRNGLKVIKLERVNNGTNYCFLATLENNEKLEVLKTGAALTVCIETAHDLIEVSK